MSENQKVFEWGNFSNMSDSRKKNTTRQIFKQNFHNASDFGLKKIQRVRFWIKNFSTCHILKNCLLSKNHVLVQFTPWKRHILLFSCFFKSMILNWKFHYVSDFELKKYNSSDFDLKKIQRVRYWLEKNTTRQILK